ncbi:MAG TPA: PqqD family protein [Gemmatimonadales bacterium]|nr:PqqD family protein [Gemmatimonadales bacterium]
MSEARYRHHADLLFTALEGEGVVLHLGERRYFTVNDTGLTLLEATREPQTFDAMVEALMKEYEVSREVAAETTRKFLDQCLAATVMIEERE